MKKLRFRLLVAAVAAVMLAAAMSVVASAAVTYEDREVHYYMKSMNEDHTVTLRFYSDMKNVPYIEAGEFYETFIAYRAPRCYLNYSKNGNIYTLYNPWGSTLTVNVATDELSTYNLSDFTYLPYYALVASSGEREEFYPFLKTIEQDEDDSGTRETVIDLSRYSIDIRESGRGELWFPLATIANLFADTQNYYVLYNGDAIYVMDLAYQVLPESAYEANDRYYSPIKRLRPKDLIEFTYNELCFTIDTFYGYPESALIAEDLRKTGGLDAYLEDYCPDIKKLLMSEKLTDYLSGMAALFYGPMFDGGHTVFNDFMWLDAEGYNAVVDALWDSADKYGVDIYRKYTVWDNVRAAREAAAASGDAVFESIGTAYYFEYGDTALFSFDSFGVDYVQWNEYYDGEREDIPTDEDNLGQFVTALRKAAENPEIKYFVVDISANGGGETSSLAGMLPFLIGKTGLTVKDMMTGAVYSESYTVDTDFDGVFDTEKDNRKADFRFALMTSCSSFSCSNLMASMMKDNGVPVIGEQSGGGTCAIESNPTPEGFSFYISSRDKLVNTAGESIDQGIPVDIPLPVLGDESSPDYSEFYDLSVISRLLNEYYGEEEGGEGSGSGNESGEEGGKDGGKDSGPDEKPVPVFTDVPEGAWYGDAVGWACSEGYMNGTSESRFSPDSQPTRAMLVTILWRLEGRPGSDPSGLPFTDVDAGSWYGEAVAWAWENEIVNGVSKDSFAPGLALTREQIATILYRYIKYTGAEPDGHVEDLGSFADAGDASSWAYEPLCWAVGNGVITGTGGDRLKPGSYSTRAQLATILYRLYGAE